MMRWMVGGVLLVCACSKPNDAKQAAAVTDSLPPGHVPIDQPANAGPKLTAAGQAYVDSGNTAFRVKDFKGALAYYKKATESDPTHAAPWFGAYMVGQATSDKALADSALAEVKKRAPQMEAHPGGAPGTPGATGAPPIGEPSPYSPHGGTVAPTKKS
ncbi:MAG: hypothetical protein U0164_21090 [Gemmatimonadaceae bacterium]